MINIVLCASLQLSQLVELLLLSDPCVSSGAVLTLIAYLTCEVSVHIQK